MIPWCHNHGNRSKMAGKQAESVIKNIIKEITIESSRKGQSVSETLAAFMVRFQVLLLMHLQRCNASVLSCNVPPPTCTAARLGESDSAESRRGL